MKTYRLYALTIITEEEAGKKDYELAIEDGLIINMEDQEKRWLIDAIITEQEKHLLEQIAENDQKLQARVLITSKNNRPAMMELSIRKITELTNKIGILLEGKMILNG